jgi:rod shape-determining protein MreD
MKHVVLAVLTYAALVLQVARSRYEFLGAASPDYLLIVAAAALVVARGWPAIVWAALAGLLSDCLTPDRLGPCMLAATATAFVFERAFGRAFRNSHFAGTVFACAAVLCIHFCSTLVRIIVAHQAVTTADLSVAATNACFTGMLAAAFLASCGLLRGAFKMTFSGARFLLD